MSEVFHTLLVLALPASGKSEVRTYLEKKNPQQFHMGPTVQLDDYPYVNLQLLIDEALMALGRDRIYHRPDPGGQRNGPFYDSFDLAALIHLLNEDWHELMAGKVEQPERAAERMFERLDSAAVHAGGRGKLGALPADVQDKLKDAMEDECRKIFDAKLANCPPSLDGKTIVIEFARGGPKVDKMPLPDGYGYRASLSRLSPELLKQAAILYIWVEPDEMRRKNRERAKPGPEGDASILFHGVPESVLDAEYSACDMKHLLDVSGRPGYVRVESQGEIIYVPAERFDNRVDLTTFLRKDVSEWTEEEIAPLHAGVKGACDKLWASLLAR